MSQICGDCEYYCINPHMLTQGACLVNPPTLFPMNQGGKLTMQYINVEVPVKRHACRHFSARIVIETAH